MRKILVLGTVSVMFLLLLTSCGVKKEDNLIKQNISDLTIDLLEGGDDNFTVSVHVGEKEKAKNLDGVCSEKQTFFLIKVTPKNLTSIDSIEYKITSGESVYNGVLAKSVASRGYSQDLAKLISYDKGFKMELTYGDVKSEIQVATVFQEGMIGYEAAIQKVSDKFSEKIESMKTDGKFNGEVVLRLISDKSGQEAKYFWYAAIVDADKNTVSTLIDCKTGDFIS